jgi:hypothetical protein
MFRKVQAMRRFATQLSFLALLLGPLVCQADAAEGLTRSLAELVAPNVIEPCEQAEGDGFGIGSIPAEIVDGGSLVDHSASSPLDSLLVVPSSPTGCRLSLNHSPALQSSLWPIGPALRRQAGLQVFLF